MIMLLYGINDTLVQQCQSKPYCTWESTYCKENKAERLPKDLKRTSQLFSHLPQSRNNLQLKKKVKSRKLILILKFCPPAPPKKKKEEEDGFNKFSRAADANVPNIQLATACFQLCRK